MTELQLGVVIGFLIYLVCLGAGYLFGQWIGRQCDTEEEQTENDWSEEVFPWDR